MRKGERERERERGERKEAETCLPQWGKKRKRQKGKGGREESREKERALERLGVARASLNGTGYYLLYSQA